MIISRWIILVMRNVSDKSRTVNHNTRFTFKNFFPENRAVYEIMSKNVVRSEATDDNIIRRVRFACWITKATNTFIILNTYWFPWQQCWREHASLLRLLPLDVRLEWMCIPNLNARGYFLLQLLCPWCCCWYVTSVNRDAIRTCYKSVLHTNESNNIRVSFAEGGNNWSHLAWSQ